MQEHFAVWLCSQNEGIGSGKVEFTRRAYCIPKLETKQSGPEVGESPTNAK